MKKIVKILTLFSCIAIFFGTTVHAAELQTVMNTYTGKDTVTLFVKNQEQNIDHVYIGNNEIQEFSIENPGLVRTVVMLDNSLSIPEEYRETIKVFLKDLVAARNDGDTFTIATFAQEITYLVEESNDYLNMKSKIEEIEFVNQESYFTNMLYTVMSAIEEYEEVQYTRVIIIADGGDHQDLGYTDDELYDRIEDTQVPIYTIGCTVDGNEKNLKRMFSLSRISNGKNYLLNETSNTDILHEIRKDTQVSKIIVKPPTKACDGSRQMVRLTYGENYAAVAVTMPFQATISSELESANSVSTLEMPALEVISHSEKISTESPSAFFLSFLVAVLGILVIIAVIVILKKTKIKKETPSIDISTIGHSNQSIMIGGNSATESLHSSNTPQGKTTMLIDIQVVKLCLQDMTDISHTFEYPLRDKVIVGKDPARCQIVINYDKYVSAIHCCIIRKGSDYYVQDGAGSLHPSTNGTFVNEQRVSPELPLPSGSILKLGRISFRVSYK